MANAATESSLTKRIANVMRVPRQTLQSSCGNMSTMQTAASAPHLSVEVPRVTWVSKERIVPFATTVSWTAAPSAHLKVWE